MFEETRNEFVILDLINIFLFQSPFSVSGCTLTGFPVACRFVAVGVVGGRPSGPSLLIVLFIDGHNDPPQ